MIPFVFFVCMDSVVMYEMNMGVVEFDLRDVMK